MHLDKNIISNVSNVEWLNWLLRPLNKTAFKYVAAQKKTEDNGSLGLKFISRETMYKS